MPALRASDTGTRLGEGGRPWVGGRPRKGRGPVQELEVSRCVWRMGCGRPVVPEVQVRRPCRARTLPGTAAARRTPWSSMTAAARRSTREGGPARPGAAGRSPVRTPRRPARPRTWRRRTQDRWGAARPRLGGARPRRTAAARRSSASARAVPAVTVRSTVLIRSSPSAKGWVVNKSARYHDP